MYSISVKMATTWIHPVTKKEYPIETVTEKGRAVQNAELLKLLHKGKYDLIKGSAFVYNLETKRLVPKKKFINRKGEIRPKLSEQGWIVDNKHPNIVMKVKDHPLKEVFQNPEYYKDAVPYNAPKKTEQAKISENPKKFEMKIMKMKEQGRTLVEGDVDEIKKELLNFPKHIHVSYVTKDNMYRAGGFLRKIDEKENYFVLWVPDKKISFPVQFKNVKQLWIKTVQRKATESKIEPTEKPATKFPVEIGDVVVYYAKDSYDRRRYMTTQKYKSMMATYEAKNNTD